MMSREREFAFVMSGKESACCFFVSANSNPSRHEISELINECDQFNALKHAEGKQVSIMRAKRMEEVKQLMQDAEVIQQKLKSLTAKAKSLAIQKAKELHSVALKVRSFFFL